MCKTDKKVLVFCALNLCTFQGENGIINYNKNSGLDRLVFEEE